MTEKLYYRDAYLASFTARVLSSEETERGFAVVLDKTAFYPEGGGQPADRGTLGGATVSDVREKNGEILHFCDRPLPVGETVTGELDFARRLDHMQQHSGEHICSGLICARYGCDNVGFHMGAETVTIDFNADIPWEELMELEVAANRYIREDHPLTVRFYEGGSAELAAVDYRSKKELTGQVRIVSFPGADCCACCGTHVSSSGAVGAVKFLSCVRFREGVRIELLAGERATRAFARLHGEVGAIGRALSVKPEETSAAVLRLQEELAAAKTRAARAEDALFSLRAQAYAGKRDVLLLEGEMESDSLRRLAVAVGAAAEGCTAVFAGTEGAYKYAVALPEGTDERAFARELNTALHGRGGGRDGFIQGSAACTEAEIRAWHK